MPRFTVPDWVRKHDIVYEDYRKLPADFIPALRAKLARFNHPEPVVSIVIPAWNEEPNILKTLSSLADIVTDYPTELVVIDNNSKDRTAKILEECGVRTVFEGRQGISLARQTGLESAKGIYHLNADADSIYPSGWVNAYAGHLEKTKDCTCVYGRYSFIPSPGNSRFTLGSYELLAENLFSFRRKNKDFLNVMGFNFAFRRADGLKVGGFNTTRPRWSDGWMAMTLMNIGRIDLVKSDDARVWTSDRRLMHDGGLGKAFINRVKKEIKNIPHYFRKGAGK
ncbi:MAG: glycosyltransferase family A protein [Bacteroidota bacterium]